MVASLTEVKADLAISLRDAGWPVRDYVPTNVQPPIVIIGAGDPYVEPGHTFDNSEMIINLEVYVIPKAGTNSREIADLDAMIETLLPHFGDWDLSVGQPESVQIQQSVYLSVTITASNTFQLTA